MTVGSNDLKGFTAFRGLGLLSVVFVFLLLLRLTFLNYVRYGVAAVHTHKYLVNGKLMKVFAVFYASYENSSYVFY